jgi:hypothetical protein
MTKAKLILSGVAFFALVGGALAFKANRGAGNLFQPVAGQTFTTTATNGQITTYYSTTTTAASFLETTTGTPTLYYRSFTITGGKTALINPTVTAAMVVPL